MTRQSSSTHSTATRPGVWYGSALLLSFVPALVGCAGDERLSLGHHRPVPTTPAIDLGAAGGASALLDAGSTATAAPPEPEPRVPHSPREPDEPAQPSAPGDAGEPASAPPPVPDAAVDGVACAAGEYAAELSCAVDPSTLAPGSDPRFAMPMRTALAFTVAPSVTPQWLEIRSGTLMFEYMGHAFLGRLSGGLDCARSEFHADIVDGSYASLFAGGTSMPARFFQGEIDGTLDRSTSTLSGSWWHGPADVPPEDAPSCVGPWVARLQSP